MPEYIEREAAIDAAFSATSVEDTAYRDVYDVANRLRLIPSASVVPLEDYRSMERTVNKLVKALEDAVQVVRCKDCKHGYVIDTGVEVFNMCRLNYIIGQVDGWFCADGKRRDNDPTQTQHVESVVQHVQDVGSVEGDER